METLTACYTCITSGLTCNKQREGCPLAPQYAKLIEQRIFEGPTARADADAWMRGFQKMVEASNNEREYTRFLHELADLGVTP